jgi:hypothetical protein
LIFRDRIFDSKVEAGCHGKHFRGLNALAHKDHALLLALSRGEFALNGFRNADARIASSAGQPGSADFVSQACGSAANVPHIGVSGPDLSAVRHLVRIATEYQIQDFDVFSIRLKTHCPVGAKPSVEI